MPFAFGHLIGAWILGKFYERKHKTLPHYAWFFLLFGAILPDADFLLDWIGIGLHRTYSHSVLGALVAALVVYLITQKKSYAVALGSGMLIHFGLDMIGGYGLPLLWPSLWHISWTSISYVATKTSEFPANALNYAIIDMALGTTWIFYLWWQKKLKF